MFIQQLEKNLCDKYAEFTGQEVTTKNELSIFHKLKFKKQIFTRMYLHDTEQIVIGSLWEFSFDNALDTKLLEFGVDCGLGERNSMGFGFMKQRRQLDYWGFIKLQHHRRLP